jgi:hypothetical protein
MTDIADTESARSRPLTRATRHLVAAYVAESAPKVRARHLDRQPGCSASRCSRSSYSRSAVRATGKEGRASWLRSSRWRRRNGGDERGTVPSHGGVKPAPEAPRRPSGGEEGEASCRGRCGGGSASPANRNSAGRTLAMGCGHTARAEPRRHHPRSPPGPHGREGTRALPGGLRGRHPRGRATGPEGEREHRPGRFACSERR